MARLYIFFLLVLFTSSLHTQLGNFQNAVDATRQDALNNGCKILDEGEGIINFEIGLAFEILTFTAGDYYVAVGFSFNQSKTGSGKITVGTAVSVNKGSYVMLLKR